MKEITQQKVKPTYPYWQLLKSAKVPRYYILLAAILIGLASVFQLLGLGLVIPVLNGLVDDTSFKGIRTTPILGNLISVLPFEHNNTNIFVFMIALIFIAVLFENLCLFSGQSLTAKISSLLTSRTRISLFNKLLGLSRSHFDHQSIAETNSLLVSFINSLNSTTNYITIFITQSCFALVYLLMMLAISWELTLCSAILLPVTYFFSNFIAKKIKRSSLNEMNEVIGISNQVDDVFRNVSLVQLEGMEHIELEKFSDKAINAANFGMKVRVRSCIVPAAVDVMNALTALIIISVSVYIFLTFGSFSLGRLLVFFISLRRFTSTLQQLNAIWVSSSAENAMVSKIWETLNFSYPKLIDGGLECQPLRSSITFNSVSFSYLNNREIIRDLSFQINANSIIALVGPTGAGKSTIAHLLPRFYDPTSGSISYDNTDIRNFKLASYRQRVGIVSQREMLFNSSIKYNITYGIKGFDESDYQKALERAQLQELIKNLPEGDSTIIGSAGSRLSGGERQRISIARVLLKNPDLLILDEPTSALDAATESKLDLALEEALKDRTVIVIAHRLATVKKAHKIIFLDNGQVLESGTYSELVEKNAKFAQYCRLQNLI